MSKSLFYDFAKMMFGAGQRIEPYVILNFITKDEFKEITGNEYQPA